MKTIFFFILESTIKKISEIDTLKYCHLKDLSL